MPKKSIYRDLLILPGLAVLSLAVLLVGWGVADHLRDSHLKSTAQSTAENWLRNLALDPGIVFKSFEERQLAFPSQAIFEQVGSYGQVFRLEFYDRGDRLFFSSGYGGWHTLPLSLPERAGATVSERTLTVTLHQVATGNGPRTYSSIAIPYSYAGRPMGTMLLFVDQTEHAADLTSSFGVIAGVTALLLVASLGICALVIGFKIRDHWRAQERISFLSHNDKLTGLANRASFTEALTEALDRRRRDGGQVAVLCIDVDKFKDVNDSLGHQAGDALLRELADRLKSNVRKTDIVARFDGDEFAVALTGLDGVRDAVRLANQIADALRQPAAAAGETIDCNLSIGVAIAPGDGDSSSVLLRQADLALVRAKSDGRNAMRFFERGMDLTFLRRRERENDLKRAIERDEFDMHYQPQVWLGDESLSGHEALVRWRHPVHGKIAPAYFISLAEETELIVPLGEWVLRRSCRDAASWPAHSKIAVNLSPVQFRNASISAQVRGILDETGLDPRRLELEITESLLMWDTETVLSELGRLRDLGITIAMDDFGTGYSSLSYLSRFPFGKIKIDRTFVRGMHTDAAVSAIISCIIGLGRSLDVTIMAEGVETTEQAEKLRKLGCDQAQGFLYGRPASAAEAAKRIHEAARPIRLNLLSKSSAA